MQARTMSELSENSFQNTNAEVVVGCESNNTVQAASSFCPSTVCNLDGVRKKKLSKYQVFNFFKVTWGNGKFLYSFTE